MGIRLGRLEELARVLEVLKSPVDKKSEELRLEELPLVQLDGRDDSSAESNRRLEELPLVQWGELLRVRCR